MLKRKLAQDKYTFIFVCPGGGTHLKHNIMPINLYPPNLKEKKEKKRLRRSLIKNSLVSRTFKIQVSSCPKLAYEPSCFVSKRMSNMRTPEISHRHWYHFNPVCSYNNIYSPAGH